MKPGDERHSTTTPSESSADESERVPSASSTAVPASTGNDTGEPSTEPASERDDPERGVNRNANREIGGRKGPDPARYGDWEKNGRCIDF